MRIVTCFVVVCVLVVGTSPRAPARSEQNDLVFTNVELLEMHGTSMSSEKVRLRFAPDAVVVETRKTGTLRKRIPYAEIVAAESSYSKHPRWKAGVGTAAGSLALGPVFLLALPVAIPLAFSKSKRHWLTVRTCDDYVVLRLDKDERKLLLPSFEVHSGVRVEALGEAK